MLRLRRERRGYILLFGFGVETCGLHWFKSKIVIVPRRRATAANVQVHRSP